MIIKRRLLAPGFESGNLGCERQEADNKKALSMGEDEEKEAIPEDVIQLRTWWRKSLNIK